MKKPIQIVVCILLVAAVVLCFVLGSARNTLQGQVNTLTDNLAQAEQALAEEKDNTEKLNAQITSLQDELAQTQTSLTEALAQKEELSDSLNSITEKLKNSASELLTLLGVDVEELIPAEKTVEEGTAEETAEAAETEEAAEVTEAEPADKLKTDLILIRERFSDIIFL